MGSIWVDLKGTRNHMCFYKRETGEAQGRTGKGKAEIRVTQL